MKKFLFSIILLYVMIVGASVASADNRYSGEYTVRGYAHELIPTHFDVDTYTSIPEYIFTDTFIDRSFRTSVTVSAYSDNYFSGKTINFCLCVPLDTHGSVGTIPHPQNPPTINVNGSGFSQNAIGLYERDIELIDNRVSTMCYFYTITFPDSFKSDTFYIEKPSGWSTSSGCSVDYGDFTFYCPSYELLWLQVYDTQGSDSVHTDGILAFTDSSGYLSVPFFIDQSNVMRKGHQFNVCFNFGTSTKFDFYFLSKEQNLYYTKGNTTGNVAYQSTFGSSGYPNMYLYHLQLNCNNTFNIFNFYKADRSAFADIYPISMTVNNLDIQGKLNNLDTKLGNIFTSASSLDNKLSTLNALVTNISDIQLDLVNEYLDLISQYTESTDYHVQYIIDLLTEGDESLAEDIQSSVSDVGTGVEQAKDDLEFDKPSISADTMDPDDLVSPADMSVVTSAVGSIFSGNNNIIVTLIILTFSVMLIGYILYGKS